MRLQHRQFMKQDRVMVFTYRISIGKV